MRGRVEIQAATAGGGYWLFRKGSSARRNGLRVGGSLNYVLHRGGRQGGGKARCGDRSGSCWKGFGRGSEQWIGYGARQRCACSTGSSRTRPRRGGARLA